MRIAIASDHAGFRYKQRISEELASLGHEVVDFGADSEEQSDYPLFIRPAAEAVASGDCERGIMLGGSGNGEATRSPVEVPNTRALNPARYAGPRPARPNRPREVDRDSTRR